MSPATFETTIMRQVYFTAIAYIFLPFALTAQGDLLPLIGIESEPTPETQICEVDPYLGTMDASGYNVGEMVNDFSLYNTEGSRIQLSQLLGEGKPVLLVSGNYTCWRYRDQLDALNAITNYYSEEMETFIIYTLEAHPYPDISPYSGTVWPTQRNLDDNVLYEQPDTYGERLAIIDEMRSELAVVPEILVDDPCNQWWTHYGPAPNNVYLVDPSGIVRVKQPWLVGYPNAGLWCELSTYFDDENANCNEAGSNGTFSVAFDAESGGTVYGSPGEVLTVPTTIENLSDTENVVIDITREDVYVQPDWQTALCVDVCYNYTVDQASVTIPPGGEQSFIFYFYTGENEGVGTASVRFSNANSLGNVEVVDFTGVTGVATSLSDSPAPNVNVFPNPTTSMLQLKASSDLIGHEFELYDNKGRSVKQGMIEAELETISVDDLRAGLYFLRIDGVDDVQQIAVN